MSGSRPSPACSPPRTSSAIRASARSFFDHQSSRASATSDGTAPKTLSTTVGTLMRAVSTMPITVWTRLIGRSLLELLVAGRDAGLVLAAAGALVPARRLELPVVAD